MIDVDFVYEFSYFPFTAPSMFILIVLLKYRNFFLLFVTNIFFPMVLCICILFHLCSYCMLRL
jgi:hypothetical protein